MSEAQSPDARPPLSEYAESALTLALISPLLLGLTALLALPVGVVGLVEVRRSNGRLRGTGHAVAAIVISLVVLATVAGLAFYVVGNPFPGACEDCQPQAMGVPSGGNGGRVLGPWLRLVPRTLPSVRQRRRAVRPLPFSARSASLRFAVAVILRRSPCAYSRSFHV